MGLFSKKQSSNANREQQSTSEPFIADDQTVARVAELMRMFNDADNFDGQHAIGGGICSAAGSSSLEQFFRGNIDFTEWMDRPWKMLAAVTLRAAQNGDHVLAGRILAFTYIWDTTIAPQLDRADLADVPMHVCPPAIEATIATVAFSSLQQLPGDQIIFSNATGSLTARDLTLTAAVVLAHAPEKGVLVDESAMAAAKSVLGWT
jgi:hypothetical protein